MRRGVSLLAMCAAGLLCAAGEGEKPKQNEQGGGIPDLTLKYADRCEEEATTQMGYFLDLLKETEIERDAASKGIVIRSSGNKRRIEPTIIDPFGKYKGRYPTRQPSPSRPRAAFERKVTNSGRPYYRFADYDARDAVVKSLDQDIAEAKVAINTLLSGRLALPITIDPRNMSIGDIGLMEAPPGCHLEVAQVLGDAEARIRCECPGASNDPDWIIRGVSMHDIVDGNAINCEAVMHVAETYRYTTVAGGSRTVYLLETIPMKAHEAYVADRIRAAAAQKQASQGKKGK